jgi:AcrR family transcriptional regulator
MIIQGMGETRRLTRAEQQAQTRTRLIDAATKVFARRGFHDASVEEIAEEAGYSHGAVYSNFDGKGDLFMAVFEDYMAERVRELSDTQTALPDDAPLAARARALADQWMDRLDRDRQSVALHMEFIAHADRDPELARRFGERSSVMRDAVSRYIVQYQRETGGELAMPVDDLAMILRALGIGLAIEALVSPDAVRHDLYGDFVELLISLQRDSGVGDASTRGESAGRK